MLSTGLRPLSAAPLSACGVASVALLSSPVNSVLYARPVLGRAGYCLIFSSSWQNPNPALDPALTETPVELLSSPVNRQGMKDKSKITLRGEAGRNEPDVEPGDVVFVLDCKPHKYFQRVNQVRQWFPPGRLCTAAANAQIPPCVLCLRTALADRVWQSRLCGARGCRCVASAVHTIGVGFLGPPCTTWLNAARHHGRARTEELRVQRL